MCYWSADILFWQLSIDHNMDVQYQVAGPHSSWKVRDFTLVARSCDYQDFSRIDNKIFLPMGHGAPRSRRAPLIKVCPLYFQPQTIMKYILLLLLQFRSNYKSNKAHSHFWSSRFYVDAQKLNITFCRYLRMLSLPYSRSSKRLPPCRFPCLIRTSALEARHNKH